MDRQPTGLFDGELERFMQAIRWEPNDSGLRLICADYLDERGHTWLSAAIREQLASPDLSPTAGYLVERVVDHDSELKHTYLRNLGLDPNGWSLVLGTRDRDEAAYASAAGEWPEGLQYASRNTLVLVDGFVEGICCMIGRLLNADAWGSPCDSTPSDTSRSSTRCRGTRNTLAMRCSPIVRYSILPDWGLYRLYTASRPFCSTLLKRPQERSRCLTGNLPFPTSRRALAALSEAARGIFVPDFATKQQENSGD